VIWKPNILVLFGRYEMTAERLPMRKIRDVLRLKYAGFSERQIAASLNIGATTAGE
jgi:ATP/maltotriose-dependent transcriptional regulator MalT